VLGIAEFTQFGFYTSMLVLLWTTVGRCRLIPTHAGPHTNQPRYLAEPVRA
jgi:hypothetical protein